MKSDLQDLLRKLPAIGELLAHADLQPESFGEPESCPRWAIADAARDVVARLRARILETAEAPPPIEETLLRIRSVALELARPRLRRVVNATGVVVHTNLGRAPLSEGAIERLLDVARGYCNLEYDLEAGGRGSRHGIVEPALCRLTGAEAAMVVNNNAAAVLLALSALASGREVVVSRGELVEIGGSFRIPDILTQSGCRLREVGTTNRTRVSDYRAATGPETALLLKVHPSNFRILGFTESVDAAELVALGREAGIPVIEDLGSGCLSELEPEGLRGEPTAKQRLEAGLDLITMSGDKLLGGPQAGVLLGRREMIEACRAHPLARALRVDRLSLGALEGTLRSYLRGCEKSEIPVLSMISKSKESLEQEALRIKDSIMSRLPAWDVRLESDSSRVGGGAFPEADLPTIVVALRPRGGAVRLDALFRAWTPPIVARVRDGALILDPRTLFKGDVEVICAAIEAFEGRDSERGRE